MRPGIWGKSQVRSSPFGKRYPGQRVGEGKHKATRLGLRIDVPEGHLMSPEFLTESVELSRLSLFRSQATALHHNPLQAIAVFMVPRSREIPN